MKRAAPRGRSGREHTIIGNGGTRHAHRGGGRQMETASSERSRRGSWPGMRSEPPRRDSAREERRLPRRGTHFTTVVMPEAPPGYEMCPTSAAEKPPAVGMPPVFMRSPASTKSGNRQPKERVHAPICGGEPRSGASSPRSRP